MDPSAGYGNPNGYLLLVPNANMGGAVADEATRPHHFSSYLNAASLSICSPSGNSSGRGPAPSMPTGVHIFWNGNHSAPIRWGGFALVRPFGQENEWNQGEDHHGHILKHPDQRHHGGLAFHQPK